jgi:polyvinyl alcohol dehydrogenase (cytochrome)
LIRYPHPIGDDAKSNLHTIRDGTDPNDFEDSIVALDMTSGALKWGESFIGYDAVDATGPDYDFGSAPNLFTATIGGVTTDVLGAGHKSGVYWALDPATGSLLWSTQVGPGGMDGGIEWGSATDGRRVYVAIDNSSNTPFNLGAPAVCRDRQ